MIQGRVTGVIWPNRSVEGLAGRKLALVSAYEGGQPTGRVVVAIDLLGVEAGAEVVVAFGSGARHAVNPAAGREVLADAAIIQRVDGTTCESPATGRH